MNHAFASRPTLYNGVQFRSRLEAQWACFFDQAKWKWDYEPMDLAGWTPTFRVEFPCGHSECSDSHVLLIDVQPFDCLAAFADRRCMDFAYGAGRKPNGEEETIPADASAAFGISPDVTYWEMGHGAGGGVENVRNWTPFNAHELWKQAGNIIRGGAREHAFAPVATGAPHSSATSGSRQDASVGQQWPGGESAKVALDSKHV